MKFDILKLIGGMGAEDLLKSVLHYATPQLAKPVFKALLGKLSPAGVGKLGRLFSLAGAELTKPTPDLDAAAGNMARVVGEIKF